MSKYELINQSVYLLEVKQCNGKTLCNYIWQDNEAAKSTKIVQIKQLIMIHAGHGLWVKSVL